MLVGCFGDVGCPCYLGKCVGVIRRRKYERVVALLSVAQEAMDVRRGDRHVTNLGNH